jgi:hypothetical protein
MASGRGAPSSGSCQRLQPEPPDEVVGLALNVELALTVVDDVAFAVPLPLWVGLPVPASAIHF